MRENNLIRGSVDERNGGTFVTVGIHTELTSEKSKEDIVDIIQIAEGIYDYAAMIYIMFMESANTKNAPTSIYIYQCLECWDLFK